MIDGMPTERDAEMISETSRQLLARGDVGDEQLHRSGTVAGAIPIIAPGGGLHGWFVPVTVGDRLAAFFQFLRDGTLTRFSSFQRRPGECGDCPLSADWIDRERIKGRAEVQRMEDETAGEPFLSFDRSPDRLVWAVRMTDRSGKERLVYIVGDTVYTPPPGDTIG